VLGSNGEPFIADFLATQIIGGAKELVVLLRLSGNI